MASTVTTRPTYAVANKETDVFITPADGATTFVRVWCTAAPAGSEIAKRIDKLKFGSSTQRALVYQGQPGTSHPWRNTFDKGGAYSLTLQSYARGSGFGGGYFGDPRGAPTETKLGGEESLTLYIAQRLTQKLGTGDDTATLVMFVHNASCVQTVASIHGETTPGIVNYTSDRARTAALTADVTAGVAALAGQSVSELFSDGSGGGFGLTLSSRMYNLRIVFNSHIANVGGVFHSAADSENTIPDEIAPNPSDVDVAPDVAAENCAEMIRLIRRHMLNDNGEGTGSAAYHSTGDAQSLPIMDGIASLEEAYAAVADARRGYEAHRTRALHALADSTNSVVTIGGSNHYRLLYLHQLFMTELAKAQPTTPPGQSSGAAQLINQTGMVEG